MSNELVLNSNTASHDTDEDDLKVLKLQDSDLEHFASYFSLTFQGNSESITILAALLKRLCGVEKLRQQKQSGIWVEDVVGRFIHLLFTGCEPGCKAAARFGNEASDVAEQIFSEALVSNKRVVGFVTSQSV